MPPVDEIAMEAIVSTNEILILTLPITATVLLFVFTLLSDCLTRLKL